MRCGVRGRSVQFADKRRVGEAPRRSAQSLHGHHQAVICISSPWRAPSFDGGCFTLWDAFTLGIWCGLYPHDLSQGLYAALGNKREHVRIIKNIALRSRSRLGNYRYIWIRARRLRGRRSLSIAAGRRCDATLQQPPKAFVYRR